MEVKFKVLAYFIRTKNGEKELLVFSHQNMPEAGIQIVGGTVEPNEKLPEALVREIYEESGISIETSELTFLADSEYFRKDRPELNKRTYFYLTNNFLPDQWEHQVNSDGEDNGMIFEFYWLSFEEAKKALTGNFAECLHLIK